MAATTTRSAAPASQPAGALRTPGRLVSLDVARGLTIAAMILVNNAGNEDAAYWPLQHAQWNGWTPTDLIFPFFLFIVGVSTVLSFDARLQRGDSRRDLLGHILRRTLIIFALGLFLNGFPNHYNPHTLRIYGVLQRIAVCYGISAVIALYTRTRGRIATAVVCLLGYWIVMRYVPVPGFGVPTHAMPLLDPDRNLVAWLDRKLLMGHLYEGTRDPEGFISTLPAIATSMLGILTGEWLRSARSAAAKAWGLLLFGVLGIATGKLANLWFPINKKLWTSSFVLFTAGCALVLLALCYWLVDIRRWRSVWAPAALVFGMNAIAAYGFAEMIAHTLSRVRVRMDGSTTSLQNMIYERFFAPLATPANASLLYALAFVALCWLAMLVLYHRKIFIKI